MKIIKIKTPRACPVNVHERCRLIHDGSDFMACDTEELGVFPEFCPLNNGEVVIRKVE